MELESLALDQSIGEPPAAAPSPNSKTTEYAKLPKRQAAAKQA